MISDKDIEEIEMKDPGVVNSGIVALKV